MEHRYIEENSIAERYLRHALAATERAEFEAHLVNCDECTDRVLLAEMFQLRNGGALQTTKALPAVEPAPASMPLRARFVAQFQPWQLVLLFAIAALLLLAIPTAHFVWESRRP